MESSNNEHPAFNVVDIRQKVASFRKLMIMFPLVHPAAIHGLLVKYKFDWEYVMKVLFTGHENSVKQYWETVKHTVEIEKQLTQKESQKMAPKKTIAKKRTHTKITPKKSKETTNDRKK